MKYFTQLFHDSSRAMNRLIKNAPPIAHKGRQLLTLLVMLLTATTAWADNINVETAADFGTLTDGKYTLVNGNTYTLTGNINTAGFIYVPAGVTATIDLAGHTIDRGLTNAVENGYVIYVEGTLTLTDSGTGGTVKGGMDSGFDHVSCVKVAGGAAFILQGGTLIGNTSSEYNNAVMGGNNTSITISGGKITGDTRGIYSYGNITVSGGEISGNTIGIQSLNYSISVSGNPVITNNTNANVTLDSSLTIAGELTVGANIGITSSIPTDNAPVTITSGYGTYNNNVSPSTYFSLDNNGQIQTSPSDYMTVVMGWNEDRTEIAVGTALYTVNFDMNGHGDAIDAVSLLSGYKLMKPEPTAYGWLFNGWYTDDAYTSQWNFNNAVTSNMMLHALWTQEAIYSFTLPEKMVIVSTTNAPVGGKYPVGTVIKFKVSSADYVVDGDVSDGTNTLTPDVDGNYTITMGDADITITATVKKAVEPNKTLSGSESYTANDGDVLTGSTSGTVTIANNAKITLSDVTITGGIVCAGTAEITLVGTNSVTGFSRFDPNIDAYRRTAGIQIGGSGTTLTINGDGSLTANGAQYAAGIGLNGAWNVTEDVIGGNIVIESGIIAANGGKGAAGIGAGFTKDKDNSSSRKAIVGNITIKGGTVTAVGVTADGGHGADGIGAGDNIYNATYQIGTVTIYDDIDKVDASAITESVTYMHIDGNTETDVTANASTYFTIIEDGNRRVIAPKDDTDYTITIANGIEHGTLTGAATAKYMEMVTINATPDFGYRLSRLVVKDAQNNDVESTGNSFFMPKSNVTVSAEFEQGTHGTTEFAWGYYEDDFVKEATIYDGVTTVNLQQGKSYRIMKYDNEYSYRKFHLDNDVYAASIPYTGGMGVFPEYGNATNFRVPYDGEIGFYDITMNDAGDGKWSVSILKTVAVMDAVPDQTYTGSEITPEPLVLAGSLSLTKGTDYVYSYTNNTNVGTAKVTVTFQGDYASLGSVEKEFKIVKSMTNNDITVTIPSQTWTGNELTPVITVKDGETVLTLDEDYTVTAPSGPVQDSGNHTYTITGMGNYSDSRETTFTITPFLADQFGAVYVYQDQNGKTALLDGTSVDPVDIDFNNNIIVNHVTSNRTFTPGMASTVMLPFNYTCNGEEGGTFYKFVGVKKENDRWVATMQETGNDANNEGTLEANTPYLFMPAATTMTFPNINGSVRLFTLVGGSGFNCETADPGSHWTFKGTYWFKEWNSNNYYDAEEIGRAYGFAGVDKAGIEVGDFVRVASGAKIRPMRAYLLWNEYPNQARALTRGAAATDEELPQSITVRLVGSNGETTGIGTLDTETGEMTFDSEAWYTLDGVRLSGKPTKKGLYINNGKKIVIK